MGQFMKTGNHKRLNDAILSLLEDYSMQVSLLSEHISAAAAAVSHADAPSASLTGRT